MDKFVHAGALLGQNKLSKSDTAFLQPFRQHTVVGRPQVFGNEAFGRFKEAVKVRLQAEQAKARTEEDRAELDKEEPLSKKRCRRGRAVTAEADNERGDSTPGVFIQYKLVRKSTS